MRGAAFASIACRCVGIRRRHDICYLVDVGIEGMGGGLTSYCLRFPVLRMSPGSPHLRQVVVLVPMVGVAVRQPLFMRLSMYASVQRWHMREGVGGLVQAYQVQRPHVV